MFNAILIYEDREQAGKRDNSYGHDQLYDEHFKDSQKTNDLFDQAINSGRQVIVVLPAINEKKKIYRN